MEEIEASETLNENGAVYKSGKIENHTDKTQGGATRIYGSGPNSTKPLSFSNSLAAKWGNEFDYERVGARGRTMKFLNPRYVFGEGFEEVKSIAEEVPVKGAEIAPQTKISDEEVSQNGISLSVDIFGPPNGIIKRNEAVLEEIIGSGLSSSNDVIEENGGSSCNKVEDPIVEVLVKEEEVILSDEHKFVVGDLVWVWTKTKSWWPGQIIDPSDVSIVPPKLKQQASLLVKYFGNNPAVWCLPVHLKPFVKNFEQVSSQGKSRVFFCAVEKAVDEFARRLKAQMTCFCQNGASKDGTLFLDKDVLRQFEPVYFLYSVKTLAWKESTTEMLELVKIRSYLSAFYQSLGHHQLPMNQLHETTNGNKHSPKRGKKSRSKDVTEDQDSEVINRDIYPVLFSEVKPEEGFELRERRRSKYMSYPYIDLNKPCIDFTVLEKEATNDVAVSNDLTGQPSVSAPEVNSTAKKKYTKRPRIPIYQPKAPITPRDLNTPLVDLLSKLQFAAVNCVFHIEGSGFDSVDRFFYGFRRWIFHDKYDPEMEHKQKNGEKSKDEFKSEELIGDKPLTSNSSPVIAPKRRRRKKNEISTTSSNAKSVPSSGVFDVNGTGSFLINFEASGSLGLQNLLEPRKSTESAKKIPELVDANGTGSFLINFEASGSLGPQNLSEPKKVTKSARKVPKLVECEITVLPDLNVKYTQQIPFVETSQLNYFTTPNGPVQNKVMKKVGPLSGRSGVKLLGDMNVNSAEYGSFVKNVKLMGPRSAQNGVDLNDHEGINNEAAHGRSDNDGDKLKGSSLAKDSGVMGLLAPGHSKPQPKKRKRKEKTTKVEARAWLASTMADLNGNSNIAKSSSQGKVLPEMNSAPGEVKSPKKRRRRNEIISRQTDSNLRFSKVHINGESSGTALVLTFAQGFPVPSREALMVTFCGFGSLSEMETKGLSDSRSAQVVFKNGPDAVEALKGIEKNHPFGPALVKCQLHRLSPVPRSIGLKPCELKANKPKEAPDLAFIKRNLEMMTSVLEKGGNNLAAEVRAKLENEVKGLLEKVSTMVGSTPSS